VEGQLTVEQVNTVYNIERYSFGRAFFANWLDVLYLLVQFHASAWLHMLPEYIEGLSK
jgi:hypothetical protein